MANQGINARQGVDSTSVFLGSSALYSGQYNSSFTRRNRTSTSNPGECDECCLLCCCGVLSGFGSLFCIRRMSRARRIQILWTWLTLLALAGGLVCSFQVFGSYSQDVAPTDMRIVSKRLSPYFCDSVTLDSNSDFTAFRFESKPEIDSKSSQSFQEDETEYIEFSQYKYWSYYLLKGSTVSVHSCSDEIMYFYVIKGFNNFNNWKKDRSCDSCILDSHLIKNTCSLSLMDNNTLTATQSDEYYFVYADGVDDMWVRANFQVQRKLYNTDGASGVCDDNVECSFNLDLHKHEVIVYHISDNYRNDDLSITIQCNVRIWFYMIAFCACPLVLGCIISVILYTCCKDPEVPTLVRAPRRVLSRLPNERTPLLWGPGPRGVIQQPPQYEDVVKDEDAAPPTYEQATS